MSVMSTNPDGSPLMTLTVGDDFCVEDGRQVAINFSGTGLPDLTGSTASLILEVALPGRCPVVVAGSVTVVTGDTRTVQFEPAASDTGRLVPTVCSQFRVQLQTADGKLITPVDARGELVVLAGYSPRPFGW